MYPVYYLTIASFLQELGIPDAMIALCVTLTLWVCVFLIAGIVYWVVTRPVCRIVMRVADRTKTRWDDYVLTPPVFQAVGLVIFIIMLQRTLPGATLFYSGFAPLLVKILRIAVVWGFLRFVIVAVNVVYEACEKQNIDHHGLMALRNVIRTVAVCIAVLLTISIILNRNLAYILSGLGAMAAVLTLVFRDTILGMVAGVKLSANKSLKKGDWIQVPSFGANGEVEDLTLTAVKVRNWDNSVVIVPPYALVTGGFQNQQEMKRSGGRRIMRSVNIDINSVRYLQPEEMAAFRGQEWTEGIDLAGPQVNLTLFRTYLERHILSARGFREDMLNMVRELQPTPTGIPIEIYLFTSSTVWKEFESVQADLLDSIVASVPKFSLRIFQNPSGSDLSRLSRDR